MPLPPLPRFAPMRTDTATVADLESFDALVDVRSPSEFADDHVPGALSCPVLDDAQRARVGTMYKQESPFAARKLGAALVARNIADHVELRFSGQPRTWRPLVYCWRGGQRSGAMTLVLRQIGWDARQLEGGYKAYRRAVVEDLARLPGTLQFEVLCGLTGSGKSRLLRTLGARGAQILDLEALAAHRGSTLGDIPGEPQPSQKGFETLLWGALRGFDPARPVYVEAESSRIGTVRVPEVLMARLSASPCTEVQAPGATRVALLEDDYRHFFSDRPALEARLAALVPLHGQAVVERWIAQAADGAWDTFVSDLLATHYDPAYRRSIGRHFPQHAGAPAVTVGAPTQAAFDAAADHLLGCPALAAP